LFETKIADIENRMISNYGIKLFQEREVQRESLFSYFSVVSGLRQLEASYPDYKIF